MRRTRECRGGGALAATNATTDAATGVVAPATARGRSGADPAHIVIVPGCTAVFGDAARVVVPHSDADPGACAGTTALRSSGGPRGAARRASARSDRQRRASGRRRGVVGDRA